MPFSTIEGLKKLRSEYSTTISQPEPDWDFIEKAKALSSKYKAVANQPEPKWIGEPIQQPPSMQGPARRGDMGYDMTGAMLAQEERERINLPTPAKRFSGLEEMADILDKPIPDWAKMTTVDYVKQTLVSSTKAGVGVATQFMRGISTAAELGRKPEKGRNVFFKNLADMIDGALNKALPDNPGLRNNLVAQQIPEILGNVFGFVATLAATKGLGGSGMLGAGAVGAVTSGQGAKEEAAILGATKSQQDWVFIKNLPFGATEAIPAEGLVMRMLNRAPIGKALAAAAVENSIQGGLQQFGQNLAAKTEYDPDRPLMVNVGSAAAIEGVAGVAAQGIMSAANRGLVHSAAWRKLTKQQLLSPEGLYLLMAENPDVAREILKAAKADSGLSRKKFEQIIQGARAVKAALAEDTANRRAFTRYVDSIEGKPPRPPRGGGDGGGGILADIQAEQDQAEQATGNADDMRAFVAAAKERARQNAEGPLGRARELEEGKSLFDLPEQAQGERANENADDVRDFVAATKERARQNARGPLGRASTADQIKQFDRSPEGLENRLSPSVLQKPWLPGINIAVDTEEERSQLARLRKMSDEQVRALAESVRSTESRPGDPITRPVAEQPTSALREMLRQRIVVQQKADRAKTLREIQARILQRVEKPVSMEERWSEADRKKLVDTLQKFKLVREPGKEGATVVLEDGSEVPVVKKGSGWMPVEGGFTEEFVRALSENARVVQGLVRAQGAQEGAQEPAAVEQAPMQPISPQEAPLAPQAAPVAIQEQGPQVTPTAQPKQAKRTPEERARVKEEKARAVEERKVARAQAAQAKEQAAQERARAKEAKKEAKRLEVEAKAEAKRLEAEAKAEAKKQSDAEKLIGKRERATAARLQTFQQWLRDHGGLWIYRHYSDPYNKKLFRTDPGEYGHVVDIKQGKLDKRDTLRGFRINAGMKFDEFADALAETELAHLFEGLDKQERGQKALDILPELLAHGWKQFFPEVMQRKQTKEDDAYIDEYHDTIMLEAEEEARANEILATMAEEDLDYLVWDEAVGTWVDSRETPERNLTREERENPELRRDSERPLPTESDEDFEGKDDDKKPPSPPPPTPEIDYEAAQAAADAAAAKENRLVRAEEPISMFGGALANPAPPTVQPRSPFKQPDLFGGNEKPKPIEPDERQEEEGQGDLFGGGGGGGLASISAFAAGAATTAEAGMPAEEDSEPWNPLGEQVGGRGVKQTSALAEPDLVELAEALNSGDTPRVMKMLLRKRETEGMVRSKGKTMRMFLKASIWKGPEIAHEIVDPKQDEDGNISSVMDEVAALVEEVKERLGLGDNDIIVDRPEFEKGHYWVTIYKKEPLYAGKVMAHEIGHIIHLLPDVFTKRGNILGQIAALTETYRKGFIEEYLGAGEGSKLHSEKEIRKELQALTLWWSPFDPSANKKYTKYRFRAVELYAEAMSVLLTNPAELKSRAPAFWRAWQNYVESHPPMKEAYDKLVDAARAEGQGARWLKRQRESFAKGREVRAAERAKKRQERGSTLHEFLWKKLKQYSLVATEEMFSNLWPIRLQQRRTLVYAKKKYLASVEEINRDSDLGQEAKDKLLQKAREKYERVQQKARIVEDAERVAYTSGRVTAMLLDITSLIIDPLKQSGLTDEHFGILLQNRRASTEREFMANALGIGGKNAEKTLAALRKEIGAEKFKLLEDLQDAYFKIRMEYVLPELNESGVMTPALYEYAINNSQYSKNSLIKFVERQYGTGTSKIFFKQMGSLGAIENSFGATMLADIQMLHAAAQNKAKLSLVRFLEEENMGDDMLIQDADISWGGRHHEPSGKQPKGTSVVSYFDGGVLKHKAVREDLARWFNNDPQRVEAISRAFRAMNVPFKAWYVVFNVGFGVHNIFKDYRNSALALPGTVGKIDFLLIRRLFQALKYAYKDAFKGELSEITRLMYKQGMLGTEEASSTMDITTPISTSEEILMQTLSKQGFETDLERDWLIDLTAMQTALGPFQWIKKFNMMTERIGKIASFLYMTEDLGLDPNSKEVSHKVRKMGGSPNFLEGGYLRAFYNSLAMFSNPALRGWDGFIDAVMDRPTQTAVKAASYGAISGAVKAAIYVGFFDAFLKAVFGIDTEEYFRKKYVNIGRRRLSYYNAFPLWDSEDGTLSVTVPMGHIEQQTNAIVFAALTSENIDDLLQEVANLNPYSLSPGVRIMYQTCQIVTGMSNPKDNFTGAPLMRQEDFNSGGMIRLTAGIEGMWNSSFGSSLWRTHAVSRTQSNTRLGKLQELPIVGSIVRRGLVVSNRGEEVVYEGKEREDRVSARQTHHLEKASEKFIRSLGPAGSFTEKTASDKAASVFLNLVKEKKIDGTQSQRTAFFRRIREKYSIHYGHKSESKAAWDKMSKMEQARARARGMQVPE